MTGARQQRKRRTALALAVALAIGGILTPFGGVVVRAEPVGINPLTGLALSGFDPVAYFTEGAPRVGRPDMELRHQGVVWRFGNAGNKAAFAGHPDVYMPRFGGFDPVAIARDVAVPGHPLYWVVVSERLYVFYDEDARAAFLSDPGGTVAAAERRWPDVARTVTQ